MDTSTLDIKIQESVSSTRSKGNLDLHGQQIHKPCKTSLGFPKNAFHSCRCCTGYGNLGMSK
ncbi:hypothetical protein Hanom_Chr14g01246831 [Helianthus anomalus]